jgi:holo-[acyl-carrier protein] synthase
MIYGVGIDLVEVPRVREIIERWGERFIVRCFSPEEISYCRRRKNSAPHFAARFAVKEAFLKCLGVGLTGGVSMRDVAVVCSERGKPELRVIGKPFEVMKEKGISSACVSISHTERCATAIVTLEMSRDF